MLLYGQYIVNEVTGFFNSFSNVGSFFNLDSKLISKQNYNKVNAIILSNAVMLNERRENDSWNLGRLKEKVCRKYVQFAVVKI